MHGIKNAVNIGVGQRSRLLTFIKILMSPFTAISINNINLSYGGVYRKFVNSFRRLCDFKKMI